MSEYLEVMGDKTADIRDASYELASLASAFYATGNIVMGETMGVLAKSLMDAQEEINSAVSKEINDRCQASQQSAANTVAACLAVSTMQNT